jgi:PTS system glucose-specific IIC component
MGDQTMMARLIANIDNSKGINFTSFQLLGLNLGRFQSDKFGFMLLGLPMAALAM